MSDSEDDYMSDKLLPVEQDVRPGLVFNRTVKRQYDLEKRKKDVEAKRPKNIKEVENELREKGLNTAISSDNKGFKMLEKMGFKQGQGLGKNLLGRTEPIKVEVKSSKSGIGLETDKKKIIQQMSKLKKVNLQEKVDEFQSATRAKLAHRFLHQDFLTAQKACENLDFQNDVQEPVCEYFWRRETIKKMRNIEEEDEEDFNDEFSLYITEENLIEIITYLRNKYIYCMFCGFVANDEQDLETHCPGPFREDHEED